MKLIIGGAFQGKKQEAVRRYGILASELADGAVCDLTELYTCKGIYHFHEYIRRVLMNSGNSQEIIEQLIEKLIENNPEVVIVCNELGYGVVPIDKFDREYRETVGRICCRAAQASDEVIRVVCSIGTVIKHG